jgi:co-chaperonin GroES (HSP10)
MKNESGFTPLDTRVLVLPFEPEKQTAGGILLPDQKVEREEWATTKATLIAAGSNAFLEWGGSAARPGAGQSVVIAQYAGKVHTGSDGKKYRICNDTDILALMESENV